MEFRVSGVAERLAAYETHAPPTEGGVDDELVERAATLLLVMPGRQRRTTIEGLVAPNDPERGRRAVDSLIHSSYAAEDETGHLRLIA